MRSLVIHFFILLGLLFPALSLAVTPMVVGGANHTVALKSNGTVVAWGDNTYGQLGCGTNTQYYGPVAVPELSGVIAVSAGGNHTVALKSNGTVVAWGNNDSGQLGDGTTTQSLSPVAVSGLSGVVAVSAYDSHNVALKSDGSVVAWGDGSTLIGIAGPVPAVVPGLSGIIAVATGASHTIVLKSGGTVMAWGFNDYGQVGAGTTNLNFQTPVDVQGLTGVKAVAAGLEFSVALKSDGTVETWGHGTLGERGINYSGISSYHYLVPGLTGVSSVAASGSHVVALKSDGTVLTWGDNSSGELGLGTEGGYRPYPDQVQGLTGIAAVAAGKKFNVVRKSDGTVVAWGNNQAGQMGNRTGTNSPVPVVVEINLTSPYTNQSISLDLNNYYPITVGDTRTLSSIASSGLAVNFTTLTPGICVVNSNTFSGITPGTCTIAANQAGNPTYSASPQATQTVTIRANQNIGPISFLPTALTVGSTTTASVTANSGLAVRFTTTTPGICIVNGGVVTGLTAGNCSIAANQDGDVTYGPATQVIQSISVGKGAQTVIFGPAPSIGPGGTNNLSAIATSGLPVNFTSVTPSVCTVSGSTVTDITGGTCIIAANQAGNVNYSAASQTQSIIIGKGSQTLTFRFAPKLFIGGTAPVSAFATSALVVGLNSITPGVCTVSDGTVTGVTAGTCTITADQAGSTNYNAATQVTQSIIVGTTLKVTPMLVARSTHTLALKSDGSVLAWGDNSNGELGDGTAITRNSPVPVPGLTGVVAIAAGSSHTVVLKSDGTLVAWGDNSNGQLGDGTTINYFSPVVVPGLTGIVAVAAGASQTIALKSNGTVMAWGGNTYGELGDGTTTTRRSPVPVPGLAGVVAIAAGSSHTVALKSDGTLVAWGHNGSGELGDGTVTNRYSPVPVPGLTGVVSVATSINNPHTLAVKSDGTVAAWGYNGNGELGDGTTTTRLSPVPVPGLTGVVAVAAGEWHTLALKSDGTVVAWGNNSYGGLGDGSTTNRLNPVPVPGLTGVVAVAAGHSDSLVLKSNGTPVAWGFNGYGQLGDGTTANRLSPVSVPVGLFADQIVSFGAAPTIVMGGTGTVSASTTSGLALSITSSTPAVCTIIDNTVTGVTAGTCSIIANQAGDANYNAATKTQTLNIGKANQNVSFGAAPTIIYKGTGTALATATSTLAVIFTAATPAICTVSGSIVTGVTVGTCTITASQAGSGNYNAATQTQSFPIGKADQNSGTISFSPTSILKGGTTTVSATASSLLAVDFTSATPGICSVSGSTVTGIAAGSCTIVADQAGNANYNPAVQTSKSITVMAILSGTVLDLSTGMPITTATVSITGVATATTQTDASGYFVFNTPSGNYDVTISKTGYKNIIIKGVVLSNTSGSGFKTGLVPTSTALLNFIAAPTLPPASTGVSYSQPLTIAGGSGPYTFSLAYGTLPAGSTLDSSVGVISGTPGVMHSSTFGIGVTDSLGGYAEREFTIDVTAPLIISTLTLTLPRGMTTTDYSAAINATGGAQPYSFSLFSGALPAGLTFDTALGMVKGKISASPGVFSFMIKVVDNEGRNVTQSYALAVDPLLTQTTAQLNDAIVGTAFSQPITATGGLAPYSWSVYAGNLPAGLSLVPATGIITGTAIVATSEPLTIAATDSAGRSVYKAYTLRALNPLLIPTTALPNGFVGAPYSEQVRVTGGIAPYSFTMSGQLPAGLTLNNSTGIVSGLPSIGGFTNVSITVTDSTWATVQTKTVTMGIRVWSQLTITSASIIPNTRKGVGITPVTLAARGGTTPYIWSVVANQNGSTSYLPQGVILDSVTGVVSGTPFDTGDFAFTIRVTDASGTPVTADKQFYLRASDTLNVVTKAVPTGAVGVQYSTILSAAGGLKSYAWIVKNGTLPAGLSLNSSSGVISGTPTAKIISNVTFEVDDSDTPSQSAQQSLSFEIKDALAISETLLPYGRQGQAYQANIRPLLGAPSYGWLVAGGALPPGVTLQQNAGIASLQGTPSTPGSYTFTLQVSDSSSPVQNATRQFTVIIYGPVTIATTALKNTLRGFTYSDAVVVSGGTIPYLWQVISGNLPQGLVFNSTTGAISGTTNVDIGFTASFTVRVTDGGNPSASRDQNYTIQAIDPLVINSTTIPGGGQSLPYSVTFAGLGGISPLSWSVASGSQPPGLTLNSTTGVMAGTPNVCGSFPFIIQLADSSAVTASVQKNFTLVVKCSDGGDSTAPTITDFNVPSTSNSLSVSITAFSATDNIGVTGYCVTSTNSASGCTWNSTVPTVLTFASAGNKTLYAFAMDAAGNVSAASSKLIAIIISGVCGSANEQTFTVSPTTNLCSPASAVLLTATATGWYWTCPGTNGGSGATCIANIAGTGIQATLKAGWNMLGWTTRSGYYEGTTAPLTTELITNATMISVGSKKISEAFTAMGFITGDTFVAVGPDGVVYTPGSPFNTLKKLLPGKGYWMYVPSDKALTLPGIVLGATDELPLSAGWTQIGYWGTDAATPAAGFASINGQYDVVVDEAGKVFVTGSPFNTLKSLQKNKGYFIHTTSPAILRY